MSTSASPNCHDLALGVAGTAVALPIGYGAMLGVGSITNRWEILVEESFTSFSFYETLDKLAEPILRSVLKIASLFYIIILTPIIEEWIFRGLVYKWQEENVSDTWGQKIFRILSNALIFAAFHINPLQGWVNIPIFVVSGISGVVFATLREMTQNIWASTIAHSLNNSFVLFITILKL